MSLKLWTFFDLCAKLIINYLLTDLVGPCLETRNLHFIVKPLQARPVQNALHFLVRAE